MTALTQGLSKLKHHTIVYDGDPSKGRNSYIGGSDVGTILGLNPYKSAFTLWLEKTGRIEPEDISNKLPVWIGTNIEDTIAKRFEFETGMQVYRSNKTYVLDDYPFIRAHVDRLIKNCPSGLECKSTSSHNKTNYADGEIPAMHYAQVQHYMMCLARPSWFVATLRDNSEFYHPLIKRDDEFIEMMFNAELRFWQHVVEDTQPEIDGSDSTTESIKRITGVNESLVTTTMNEELHNLVVESLKKRKELDSLKHECNEIDNRIKMLMSNSDVALSPLDDVRVSYKWVNGRGSFDTKQLKKDHPEIFEQYFKAGTPLRRFEIKEM